MLDDVLITFVVVGGLFLLLILVVAGFVVRRLVLMRPVGTFECLLRRDATHGTGRWMLGVARYEDDRLEWFKIFAFSPRPGRVLTRSRLELLERRVPAKGESRSMAPGTVVAHCAYGPGVLELAMSEAAYNGFAAWLESAPPGPTTVHP